MNPNERVHVPQEDIDWLVEGEMRGAQRDELFKRLDGDPNGWRRCAITFMERDALIAAVSSSTRSPNDQTTPFPSPFNPTKQTECKTDSVLPSSQIAMHNRTSRGIDPKQSISTAKVRWSFAIAVMFVTGLGIGRFTVEDFDQQPSIDRTTTSDSQPEITIDQNNAVDSNLARQLVQNDPQTVLNITNAVNRLSVADSEVIALISLNRQDKAVFLPVIQSATLERQFERLPQPTMPPDYASQLQRAGWRMNYAREFLSFHLPNGKNQILPVDLFNYRYVGLQTF